MIIRQRILDAAVLKMLYIKPNQSGSASWFTFTQNLTYMCPDPPSSCPSPCADDPRVLATPGRKQGQGGPWSAHVHRA